MTLPNQMYTVLNQKNSTSKSLSQHHLNHNPWRASFIVYLPALQTHFWKKKKQAYFLINRYCQKNPAVTHKPTMHNAHDNFFQERYHLPKSWVYFAFFVNYFMTGTNYWSSRKTSDGSWWGRKLLSLLYELPVQNSAPLDSRAWACNVLYCNLLERLQ